MNVLNFYTNRQLRGNIGQRLSLDFKVADIYCSHEEQITYETEAISLESPILATAYDGGKHIASANEVGTVDLCDIYNLESKAQWELHQNAIFDIKWRPNVSGQLLTASGDLSITLVDIQYPKEKIAAIEKSHICSVRSVDFHDYNVFASGARDGHVKVWDLRDYQKPLIDIPFAHVADTKLSKRRSKRYRSCPANVVTSILFSGYHLYSGGASDGLIKVWDIRKQNSKIQPLKQMSYRGNSNFSDKQGYTCLVMSKGFLFASCSDKIVYCYSPYQEKIVGRYKGARINNYSKISILNDEYLICGSMDSCACLWKINHQQGGDQPIFPSFILPESSEVDSVEAVNEMGLIFTGTDQGRLRRWTFEPVMPDENRIVSFDKIKPFEEEKRDQEKLTKIMDKNSENIPTITVEDNEDDATTHTIRYTRTKRNLFATPVIRGDKRSKKRRCSPRTISPKGKKSRTKPSEPLTPITNYYQKLPKNDSPKKGQS